MSSMNEFYSLLANSADENGTVRADALRNAIFQQKERVDAKPIVQSLDLDQASSKRPRSDERRPQTARPTSSRHGALLLRLASGQGNQRPTSAVHITRKTELQCNVKNIAVPLLFPVKPAEAKARSDEGEEKSKETRGGRKTSDLHIIPTTVLSCRPPTNARPPNSLSGVARTPKEGGEELGRYVFPSLPMSDRVLHHSQRAKRDKDKSSDDGGLRVGGTMCGTRQAAVAPTSAIIMEDFQTSQAISTINSFPPPVSESSSIASHEYSQTSDLGENSQDLKSTSPQETQRFSPAEMKCNEFVMESAQESGRGEPLQDSSRLLVAAVRAIRERDAAKARAQELEARIALLQDQLSEAEQKSFRSQVSANMQKQDFIRRTESLSSELYDAKSNLSELQWKLNVAYRQMESEARFPPGEERAQFRHFIMKWMSNRLNAAFSSWSELTYDSILMRRFVKRLFNRKLAKCFDNFVIATKFVQEFNLRDRFIEEHETRTARLEEEWRRMEREREDLRKRKERMDEEMSLRMKDGSSVDLPVLLSEIRMLTLENLNLKKSLEVKKCQ